MRIMIVRCIILSYFKYLFIGIIPSGHRSLKVIHQRSMSFQVKIATDLHRNFRISIDNYLISKWSKIQFWKMHLFVTAFEIFYCVPKKQRGLVVTYIYLKVKVIHDNFYKVKGAKKKWKVTTDIKLLCSGNIHQFY